MVLAPKGRGQLSSLDLLPPEADEDVQWAVGELAARERTQADILFELNDKLGVIGAGPISPSAFNRFAIRKYASLRKLKETREIAQVVAAELGPEKGDDVTVLIVQLFKEAIHSHLERGAVAPGALKEMGQALAAVMSAQKSSGEQKRLAVASVRKDLDRAAEAAADGIAANDPTVDRKAVLAKIREEVYGIIDP